MALITPFRRRGKSWQVNTGRVGGGGGGNRFFRADLYAVSGNYGLKSQKSPPPPPIVCRSDVALSDASAAGEEEGGVGDFSLAAQEVRDSANDLWYWTHLLRK